MMIYTVTISAADVTDSTVMSYSWNGKTVVYVVVDDDEPLTAIIYDE